MATPNNSFGTYTAGTPSLKILPTLSFECEKIKSLPVKQKILLKLRVSGKNGWFADKYDLELVPSSDKIKLSKTSFRVEEEWVIKFYIECSEVLSGNLLVKIDGKDSNKVNLNFINNAKDVFSEEDVKRLIDENIKSLSNRTECFIAADNQNSELLQKKEVKISSYSNENGFSRMKSYTSMGYIKDHKKFNQYIFDTGGITKPSSYVKGKEKEISSYIKKIIEDKIGYHVFYYSLLFNYHILTIVVDNTNPCGAKYKIYDQLKDRGEYKEIEELDGEILTQTVNNWEGAVSHTAKKTDASTQIDLWKVQRK
ncbi:hypothetical protein [Flavobacterium sp.]|uniref:hypothetical protein n=1 Tax=Flavobacterium sp. TaxID=239 RepID=UPI00286E94FD|nr:hypothetical protein [Flavobacterium sp.]